MPNQQIVCCLALTQADSYFMERIPPTCNEVQQLFDAELFSLCGLFVYAAQLLIVWCKYRATI